jgi:hypothetical protein
MKKTRSRKLQRRLDAAVARAESLGGGVGIPDDTPDDILEAFLDELEGCPLCRELERGRPPRAEH